MAYQPYDARCKFCGQSRIVYPGCCASARSLDEHTLSRYGLSIYPSMEAVLDLLRKASDSPTLMEIEAYVRRQHEETASKQKACSHTHPDGSSAWNGGFADYNGCCTLCGLPG